jgi:hypothetical protein
MSQKTKVVDVKKFNIKKFNAKITPEDINKQSANKNSAVPYYGRTSYQYICENGEEVTSQPCCMTGDIKIVYGGIPRKPAEDDEKNPFSDETKRAIISVPFDKEQTSCLELRKVCEQIDKMMEEKKKDILAYVSKDDLDKYEYSSLIKEPSEKAKDPKYETFKMKFNTDFRTKEIQTRIFVKQPDGTNVLQTISSLADVEKYVRWGCTIRCVFTLHTIWATRAKINKKYMYGVGAKIMQIVVKSPGNTGAKDAYDQFMFDDEGTAVADKKSLMKQENRDDDEPKKQQNKPKLLSPVQDDEDDDEEEPTLVKKPLPTKEEDSEEESDDEKSPKKSSPKKVIKIDSGIGDSDDDKDADEDADEKPKSSKSKSRK